MLELLGKCVGSGGIGAFGGLGAGVGVDGGVGGSACVGAGVVSCVDVVVSWRW